MAEKQPSETSSLLPTSVVNTSSTRAWKFGIVLVSLSGILHTANNFLVQFFEVDALELLLVRSAGQSVILGLIAASADSNLLPSTFATRIYVAIQALLAGIRLYLNFRCLAFLPLGDALTIIFTEPLFTVVLSLIFLRVRIGVWKGALCLGLAAGMVLCVQPPFIFSQRHLNFEDDDDDNNGTAAAWNISDLAFGNETTAASPNNPGTPFFTADYYFGVILAIGCAVCGSLCNIAISRVGSDVSSAGLVFYSGLGGIVVAIVGSLADRQVDRVVGAIGSFSVDNWVILVAVSAVGIVGYLCYTASLKSVTPTSVSVLRSQEIVLAYFCQVAIMGVWPNALCICGAALVMGSVVGIAIEEKYISDGSDDESDSENGAHARGDQMMISISARRRNSSLTYP